MGDTTRKKRVRFQGIEVEPQEVALVVKYEVEVVATTDGVATTESRQSTQTKIRVKTLSESSNVEKLAKQIAEKCKLIPDSKVPLVVNKLYELQFQVTGGGGENTAPNEGGGSGPSAAEQEAAEREERDRQYRQEQDARAREDEDRRRREDEDRRRRDDEDRRRREDDDRRGLVSVRAPVVDGQRKHAEAPHRQSRQSDARRFDARARHVDEGAQ